MPWLTLLAEIAVLLSTVRLSVGLPTGVVDCNTVFTTSTGCANSPYPPRPLCGPVFKNYYNSAQARLNPKVEGCLNAMADARVNGSMYLMFGYWCRDSSRYLPLILKGMDEFAAKRARAGKAALAVKPVCISNGYNRALPYYHRTKCNAPWDTMNTLMEHMLRRKPSPLFAAQRTPKGFSGNPTLTTAPIAVFAERENNNPYGFIGDLVGELGAGLPACAAVARPKINYPPAYKCNAASGQCTLYAPPSAAALAPGAAPQGCPQDEWGVRYGAGYCTSRKAACGIAGFAVHCKRTCQVGACKPTPASKPAAAQGSAGCVDEFDARYGNGYCKMRSRTCSNAGFAQHCKKTCQVGACAGPMGGATTAATATTRRPTPSTCYVGGSKAGYSAGANVSAVSAALLKALRTSSCMASRGTRCCYVPSAVASAFGCCRHDGCCADQAQGQHGIPAAVAGGMVLVQDGVLSQQRLAALLSCLGRNASLISCTASSS